VVIAAWGIRGLVALAPAGLPRINEVHVDLRVLLFASAVSLAASLIFGLAPALHASRSDLNEVMKQGGRTMSGGGSHRMRAALIVFETAAAVVLVIGAGLLIRSFAALSQVDLGFRTERLLVADTAVPTASRGRRGRRRAVLSESAAAARGDSRRGVRGRGDGRADRRPIERRLRHRGWHDLRADGCPIAADDLRPSTRPGYFATLGVPIVRGRDFADTDNENAPLVAVVNEALARASFPGEDAIGPSSNPATTAPASWRLSASSRTCGPPTRPYRRSRSSSCRSSSTRSARPR
jgi:hypothetical protein